MKSSPAGQQLIKVHESKGGKPNLVAYKPLPDPKEPWTIGYGFIKGVKEGDTMTAEEADARFNTEILPYEEMVDKACTLTPNQNQFDALLSLCYNCPVAVTNPNSSVMLAHNRGDFIAASKAFNLYDVAHGNHEPGLLSRRMQEGAYYLTPTGDEEPHPMPQAVSAPPSFVASKINQGAILGGAATTIAGLTETVNTINAFKSGVDGLGTWLVPILMAVAVLAILYIVYERIQLRSKGQA